MKFSTNKNLDALMKVGASIALFLIGKKVIAKQQKRSGEADMDTNDAAGQAASLKQALNPSGYRWMKNFDGTDKEAIWRIAPQITNLDDVNSHYKKIAEQDSLYDDLQSSLSPDEYQKFLSLGTKGKVGSYYFAPKSDKVPSNQWVITTAEANVRRTPKLESKYSIGNNIVKLAPKGHKLGASTGKFVYDENNKVVFIEFWTFTKAGKKKNYYVAKSQIEFVTKEELAKREKQEKIPLQVIEGFGKAENELDNTSKEEVISTDTAIVYDEKFNQIGLTPKDVVMGFPIMTLTTGKGAFIQFKTLQVLKRWIREDAARIQERRF
jgi:hypothetical protein